MAFPHPQSRKDHNRKEDVPSCGGVVWKFFKRTVDITEFWYGNDDVNPAKNRTLGDIFHDEFVLLTMGALEEMSVQVTTLLGP